MYTITATAPNGRPVIGIARGTFTFRQHAEARAAKLNAEREARGSHVRWIVTPA